MNQKVRKIEAEKFDLFLRKWRAGMTNKAYLLARSSLGYKLGYDSDDFMSEFYLILLRCIREWRPNQKAKFHSYFWTSTKHSIINKLVSVTHAKRAGEKVSIDTIDPSFNKYVSIHPEEFNTYKFYVQEFTGIMKRCFGFSRKERNIMSSFVRMLSEGYSYSEIASRLERPLSDVKYLGVKMSKNARYKSYEEGLTHVEPRNSVLASLSARVVCPITGK